jgi:hypothetical protein
MIGVLKTPARAMKPARISNVLKYILTDIPKSISLAKHGKMEH